MKSKKLREGASKYTRFCVSSIATVTHHEPVKCKKQEAKWEANQKRGHKLPHFFF